MDNTTHISERDPISKHYRKRGPKVRPVELVSGQRVVVCPRCYQRLHKIGALVCRRYVQMPKPPAQPIIDPSQASA